MNPLLKNLVKMSFPIACSHLVLAATSFIVMFLLAQLGGAILPASYVIVMTRLVISLTFMSTLFAFGPMISRQYAHAQHENSILQQGWLVGLLVSLLPMAIASQIKHILEFFHQPPQLIPLISEYFQFYMWAIPFAFLSTINQQFLLGTRQQSKVLFLHLCNMILSACLNYDLIFGRLFFPRLELEGAGIASILIASLSFILSTLIIYQSNPALFKHMKWPNFQWGWSIIKIGHPICLKTGNDMLSTFVMMLMIGWLGEISLSASQISNEYALLILMLSIGISDACALMVGDLLKNAKEYKLSQLSHIALALSIIPCCIGAIVFFIFETPLINYFIVKEHAKATDIFELTVTLFYLRLLKVFLSSLSQTYIGLLRGLYITSYPFWISILNNWIIMLPLAFLLCFKMNMGVKGLLVASIVTEVILLICLNKHWTHAISLRHMALKTSNL